MEDFLRRNKTIITSFIVILILFSLFIYKSSAYTYETLDFKYGKVNTKNTLNVRCGPGTNYDIVGKLKKGEYVDVFAKVGEWYIIQTDDNLVGTVSEKYIEKVLDETEVTSYREQKALEKSVDNKNDNDNTIQTSYLNEKNESSDEIILTKDEEDFLDLINSNRKNNGVEKLKLDDTIQNIARLKAEDLERNDYFSHESPNYGSINDMLISFGVNYSSAQENIAGNQNLSGAVEAWMNSESHRANILNKDFNYTGVAIADSKTYGKIFVEIFVKK